MKYSLTQLLLEDTEFQRIDFGSLPSAEEADKVRLLNTYWYAQKLAGAIIDKIAEKGMEKLYTWGSPSVRRKIEAARAYVKRREEDINAIVESTAYCDYIWSVFDPAGSASDDDKKKLARCLGFFSDVIMREPKIAPSAGQPDDEFKAQIIQGCDEMKLAAAIAAIEETRVQVGRKTMELRKVVEESLVAEIRNEIGEKGASWNIDLAEDPEIKPLLDAGEDMRALFEEQLDEKGRELTFMGNARVAYRISRGGGVGNMCSTGPIREGIDAARALLLELADDDVEDEPEASGPALQPDPRNLDEAIDQIGQRFTTAKSINGALRKSFSTETIDRVARATQIKKIRFQFPSEDGFSLGKPTLITTQTSISLERIAAGIFRSFLAGARTRAVQPAVIAMIAEQVDPEFVVDPEGGSSRRPNFTVIFRRVTEGGGIQANRDMQSAFIYAICAVAEYSSQYGTPEADNIGPTDILSRGRSALQDILAFHAMGTRFPDSKYASDIRIAPGADPESWIKKFVRSAKYPGTPAQKLAALKQAMKEKQITTFKVFPYVEFDQEDALTSPAEETGGKRGANSKIAMEAIKKLIDGTAKLAKEGMKSKAAMTKPDRTPDTRGVGHLSMIALCDQVALVVNQSRRRGIGKLLMLMGYTAPDSLLLGPERATGQMVWERMCDRASVPFSSQPSYRANFDQSNHNAWRPLMTGSNKLLALKGLAELVAAELVNLPVRATYHAIEQFTERRLLSTGPEGTSDLRSALVIKYAQLLTAIESSRVSMTVTVDRSRSTRGMIRTAPERIALSEFNLGQVDEAYDSIDPRNILTGPSALDSDIVVGEGAPLLVDPAQMGMLVSAGAPDAGGGGESGADEEPEDTGDADAEPPPGPGPTPTPDTPPAAETVTFDATYQIDGVPGYTPSSKSDVSVEINVSGLAGEISVSLDATVSGGSSQVTAAKSNSDQLTLDEGSISGVSSDAEGVANAVRSIPPSGTKTLADVVRAIEEAISSGAVSGTHPFAGRVDIAVSVTIDEEAMSGDEGDLDMGDVDDDDPE